MAAGGRDSKHQVPFGSWWHLSPPLTLDGCVEGMMLDQWEACLKFDVQKGPAEMTFTPRPPAPPQDARRLTAHGWATATQCRPAHRSSSSERDKAGHETAALPQRGREADRSCTATYYSVVAV